MPTAKALRLVAPRTSDKYQVIFDQASDAILAVDPSGFIDAANQAAEELSGWMKSELVGGELKILSPGGVSHRAPGRSKPFGPALLEQDGTYEDVAIARKDGYVRIVDLTVRTVSNGDGFLRLLMVRDVSEKKRMERELLAKHSELMTAFKELERKNAELSSMQDTLVQAGKMAALGELAFGIAHELNQPLMGIRGYAQELQVMMKSSNGAHAEEFLGEIVSCVDKMSGIISYLRTHVRKSGENFEMTGVHRALEEAMKMLSRQFVSRGIVVHRELDPALPDVYANPLQLEQVFINLATNARDAIESGGRGSGNVWISTRLRDGFVEVLFKDDGCGMNDRTKGKAFNPFFTTKDVGKGMGMGLSLSYGVISKLHGSIVVESEMGKGTAFTIRLPLDYRELG